MSVWTGPDSPWRYRKRVTLDPTKIAGTGLEDFPVSIDLTADTDVAANARPDLRDLRFVDRDGNLLTHDVERHGQTLSPDGVRSWWTRSDARYLDNGLLVFGRVTREGDVAGTGYDPATGDLEHFTLHAAMEIDDHDNPGFVPLSDGRVIATYCKHGDIDGFRFRITLSAVDTLADLADANWDTEVVVAAVGTDLVSYPTPVRLSDEDRIYVFFRRGGSTNQPYVTWSDDDGDTWSTATRLVSPNPPSGVRPYVQIWDNGVDRIHIVMTDGHPTTMAAPGPSLYYFSIEAGGDIRRIDGELITTLAALESPDPTEGMAFSDLTKVHDSAVDGGAWGWDVSSDPVTGHPIWVYATFPDPLTDHLYWYARWTGTAVEKVAFVHAGGHIYEADGVQDNYSAGIALLPEDPTVIFAAVQTGERLDGNAFDIHRYQATAPGRTLAVTFDEAVTLGGHERNARPFCPRGRTSDSSPAVIWWSGLYLTYTAYHTRMQCWPCRETPTTIARVLLPTVDDLAELHMYYGNPDAADATDDVFDADVVYRAANYGRVFDSDPDDFAQDQPPALGGLSGLTIEAYVVLPSADASVDSLLSTWTSIPTTARFLLRVDSLGRAFELVCAQADTQVGGTFTAPGGVDLRDGEPHSVVMAYDTTLGLQCWVDGVKSATTFASTATLDATSSTSRIFIGRSPHDTGSRSAIGSIEDIRISAVRRSDDWIETSSFDRFGLVLLGVEHLADRSGVVLDPIEVADNRVEVHLHEGAINILPDGIDWGDAQIEQYRAEAARGQIPVDYRTPNRTITIPLLVGADGPDDFVAARRQLQAKVALMQRKGGWLKRGEGLYCDVVNATLHLPDKYSHLDVETGVTLTLDALPDFYADEIELDEITATGEIDAVLQKDGSDAIIDGDYPARTRIVIDNDGSQAAGTVIWGFRSSNYSADSTAQLVYDAEDLTPISPATAVGSDIELADVPADWTAALSTDIGGDRLTHIGTYRIIARIHVDGGDMLVRLRWRCGEDVSDPGIVVGAPLEPEQNPPAELIYDGEPVYFLADLGQVRIDRLPTDLGALPQWEGHIEFSGSGAETASINKVWVVPIDDGAGSIHYGGVIIDVGHSAQIRTDGVYRERATEGTYQPIVPFGDLPRLPPSGLEQRPVELFVKTSNVVLLTGGGSTAVNDEVEAVSARVFYRPSWLVCP